MQFPIQHEKKMTLSMIYSHMKLIGLKNMPDFGKFPMLLPIFIAQARCSVRKPSSSKDFWPWARREILAQHGLQPQNSTCSAGWGWGGGKRRKENGEVWRNTGCARHTSIMNQCDFPVTMKLQGGARGNTHTQTPNSWNLQAGDWWWDLGHRFGAELFTSKQRGHLKNPWALFLPCCLKHPYFSLFKERCSTICVSTPNKKMWLD